MGGACCGGGAPTVGRMHTGTGGRIGAWNAPQAAFAAYNRPAEREGRVAATKPDANLLSIRVKAWSEYTFCKINSSHAAAIKAEFPSLTWNPEFMLTTDLECLLMLDFATHRGELEQKLVPFTIPAGFVCNGVSAPSVVPDFIQDRMDMHHTTGWWLHDYFYATTSPGGIINEGPTNFGIFMEPINLHYQEPGENAPRFATTIARLEYEPGHKELVRRAADCVLIEPLRVAITQAFAADHMALDFIFAVPGGTTQAGRAASTVMKANPDAQVPSGQVPADDQRVHWVTLDRNEIAQQAEKHFKVAEHDREDIQITKNSEQPPSQREKVIENVRLHFNDDAIVDTGACTTPSATFPREMVDAARATLNKIKQAILEAFTDQDPASTPCVEIRELAAIVKSLGLEGVTWFHEPVFGKRFNYTIAAFVDKAAEAILKHHAPVVHFLAELGLLMARAEQEGFSVGPPDSDARKFEIRRAVAFAVLLEGVTSYLLQEPMAPVAGSGTTLLEKMVVHFQKLRKDAGDFYRFFNLFGKMKIPSVCFPVEKRLMPAKAGTLVANEKDVSKMQATNRSVKVEAMSEISKGGVTMSLNVLEATLTDVLRGCGPNAEAGFELLTESCIAEHSSVDKNGISCKWNGAGDGEKPNVQSSAAWNNLYMSWNMAFVSHWEASIHFFPKLLFPCILEVSTQDPSRWMFVRAVSLYILIQWMISERVAAQSDTLPTETWSSDDLTALWNVVNGKAAKGYQRMMEKQNDRQGFLSGVGYDMRRGKNVILYKPLAALVRGAGAIKEEGIEFLHLMKTAAAVVVGTDEVEEYLHEDE